MITTADVILRDTITLPIKGTFELTQHAMVIAVFCAYGITQVKESHIIVDVIATHLPRRPRAVLDAVLLFLALVFFVTAAWIGYEQTLVMMRRGAFSDVLAVDRRPFQGMVVIGFISLCLAVVRSFLFAVARALGRDIAGAPSPGCRWSGALCPAVRMRVVRNR